jgi:protein ImuA
LREPSTLAELRARIRTLEGGGGGFGAAVATLGVAAIDAALPWGGLPFGMLHELRGSLAAGGAAAFAGRFLRHQAAGRGGALVWCEDASLAARQGRLYGPGLARFGIAAERLVVVRCWGQRQVLWAAHEALRSSAVACVVAELETLDLLAGRRLQLAAEAGGAAGLIRRFGRVDEAPSAAATRWRVEPFFLDAAHAARCWLDAAHAARCWSLDLWRVKGGVPGRWLVRRPLAGERPFDGGWPLDGEWNDQTLSVAAADQSRDRPAPPQAAPAGRGAA